MLRAAFFRPGAAEPYATVYAPVGPPPDGQPCIIGGEITVLRGGFPDQGSLELSAPIGFRAKDWVRVWLPGDTEDDPTYTGECRGEPWQTGRGTVELSGIWESFKRLKWTGSAKGDFPAFFGAVLSKSDKPAYLPVDPLPAISSVFSSDVPFELLGDTVNAITPALDGYLIGVTARPAVACVDPGIEVTHRFPAEVSDRPPGSTDNYANAVRYSFEYPSGDTGYVEHTDTEEVARAGGLIQWSVEQVTAREIGLPLEPYAERTGTTTRTTMPGGLMELRSEAQLSGKLFGNVTQVDVVAPSVTALPPVTYPAGGSGQADAERARVEESLRGLITFQQGVWQRSAQSFGSKIASQDVWWLNGAFVVNLTLTTLPGKGINDTLRWGVVADAGNVQWLSKDSPNSGYNRIWTESGTWELVPGETGVYRLLIDPNHVDNFTGSQAATFVLAYEPAFLDAARAAGVKVRPIEWRGGGRLTIWGPLDRIVTQLQGDQTAIQPALLLGGQMYRPRISFPMFSGAYPVTHDPAQKIAETPGVSGSVLYAPNAPLELEFGSSVEVELLPGGTVGGAWVLHDLDTAAAQSEALKMGTGYPDGVAAAAAKARPTMHTVLTPAEKTPDGWARFAVRRPDSWNGQGDPPPAMTLKHLLLTGATQVGRVRIKTPALEGLLGYGARLLRYKARPMRDWVGQHRDLKRYPALGTAAFQVPGQADDELLDVQKVTYDLGAGRVFVQAGSPVPADDVDAVGTTFDSIRRTIRRAGGNG